MYPETTHALSPAVPALWRDRGTGIPPLDPHWSHSRSNRKPKARQQSRQAGRQRKKPWDSAEWVDQIEGHQEQRKTRSNWGKCQGHFFDSSCKCSANFSLRLPLPTFSVPWATCQGMGGKCWDLLSALPAATPLNGSCPSCLCAHILKAQDYHMPFRIPHLVNPQNQRWAKLLSASDSMQVVGQKIPCEWFRHFASEKLWCWGDLFLRSSGVAPKGCIFQRWAIHFLWSFKHGCSWTSKPDHPNLSGMRLLLSCKMGQRIKNNHAGRREVSWFKA